MATKHKFKMERVDMGPLQNAGLFLLNTIADLYLLILLLRFVLQYLRVDFYNPLSQFIVKATNPIVVPLRRIIPGYLGMDLATLVALVSLTILKLILFTLIGTKSFPHVAGLLIWTVGDITTLTIKLFFYAVLLSAVLSWVAPTSQSPAIPILYRLTEPLMRPARRFIPRIGGVDISPIPVIIFLQLLIILIGSPLTEMGSRLALR